MAAATFARKSGALGALRYGVPWRGLVIHGASILIMLWIILPFAWVVLTSLMTEVESLSKPPHWIPDYITFDNYLAFFNPDMLGTQRLTGGAAAIGAGRAMVNSAIVALSVAVLNMVVGSLVILQPLIALLVDHFWEAGAKFALLTYLGAALTLAGLSISLLLKPRQDSP